MRSAPVHCRPQQQRPGAARPEAPRPGPRPFLLSEGGCERSQEQGECDGATGSLCQCVAVVGAGDTAGLHRARPRGGGGGSPPGLSARPRVARCRRCAARGGLVRCGWKEGCAGCSLGGLAAAASPACGPLPVTPGTSTPAAPGPTRASAFPHACGRRGGAPCPRPLVTRRCHAREHTCVRVSTSY